MSRDEIQSAYDRISGRFPAEWRVVILVNMTAGRKERTWINLHGPNKKQMARIDDLDVSLHVTAGGIDYVEIDVDLDDIESAAEAIIEQIAAADMADPAKSRRGLDRLANALQPASEGSGRAA